MPIKYALYENHLTADPSDYAAIVQITSSADLEQIADRMIQQGSTTTKADILAVLEDTITACEGFLIEGYRVNFDGLCQLFPRVQGIFDSAMDGFDPARHRIDVGANPGSRIRETVRDKASAEKVETPVVAPVLIEFIDLASGAINSTVTTNSIGTINGYRLKYDPAQADEGLFFVPTPVGGATKVNAVQKNKPSQLVILNPGLVSGFYRLEVRARIRGGTELRTGRLDAVLTVS